MSLWGCSKSERSLNSSETSDSRLYDRYRHHHFFRADRRFFGLEGVKKHEYFHENIVEIFKHIGTVNGDSLLLQGFALG